MHKTIQSYYFMVKSPYKSMGNGQPRALKWGSPDPLDAGQCWRHPWGNTAFSSLALVDRSQNQCVSTALHLPLSKLRAKDSCARLPKLGERIQYDGARAPGPVPSAPQYLFLLLWKLLLSPGALTLVQVASVLGLTGAGALYTEGTVNVLYNTFTTARALWHIGFEFLEYNSLPPWEQTNWIQQDLLLSRCIEFNYYWYQAYVHLLRSPTVSRSA